MFLYIFEALCGLAVLSFIYSICFPGPIHEYPEGYIEEVPERSCTDILDDSYKSWKSNITNTFEASKN